MKTIRQRKVKCLEDDIIFPSITECAGHYNVSVSTIAESCRFNDMAKSINKSFRYASELYVVNYDKERI